MKIFASNNNTYMIAAISVGFAILMSLSGCSDEEKPKQEATAAAPQTQPSSTATAGTSGFDHAHGPEVTDMEKHKFEHDFAAQCVDRELKNSANPTEDKERLSKSCECIATYLMKDLTAQEAEKFIKEREHPHSLSIKYDAASYHCLQEKTQPAGPKLFGKPTENNL